MLRRPLVRLILLGLASALVYAYAFTTAYPLEYLMRHGFAPDMAVITWYSKQAVALYVGGVTLLFALYLGSILTAARLQSARAWPWVLGVGVGMGLLLVGTYPFAASDAFLYIARGRVLGVYGQNSMSMAPIYFSARAYVPFPSEWLRTASPYGPLWEWVAGWLAALGHGNPLRSILVFKLFNLVCYALGCLLVVRILRRRGDGHLVARLVTFAWNPLVLLESMANGHNDLLMVLFVLLALWCWEHQRYTESLLALALGGMVKFLPWFLIPLTLAMLWRRVGWRRWLRISITGGTLALLVMAVLWAPLWPGWSRLEVLQQMGRGHHSVFVWLTLLLRTIWSSATGYYVASWLLRISLVVAYAGSIVMATRRDWSLAQSYHQILAIWLFLGAASFGYWYIVWLCALLPFLQLQQRRLWTLAFALCGLMSVPLYSFMGRWFSDSLTMAQVHLIVVPIVFGLPFPLAYWAHHVLPNAYGHAALGSPRPQAQGAAAR